MIAGATSKRGLTVAKRFVESIAAFVTSSGDSCLKPGTTFTRAGFAADATSASFHTLEPVEFEDGVGQPTGS